MIAYAAIDLAHGKVVQLVGGRPEAERVRLSDPPAVARRWAAAGFAALHVVDLDAALGRGSNTAAIHSVIRAVRIPVQVGGGVREEDDIARLLEAGAARVVAGTRAVEDREWLGSAAKRFPDRIVVAADVRDRRLVTRGWTTRTDHHPLSFLGALAGLPLAGVLATDVSREGRMTGIDEPLFSGLAAAAPVPLLASGGIAGPADLDRLERAGAAGAVLGMALYTGAIPLPLHRWNSEAPTRPRRTP